MELAYRTAGEIAALIRSGEIGSEELLDHYLDRIARHNGALNAVVGLEAEAGRARARARAADAARRRGEFWGPLHGLPMTIKDSFEVAGFKTTSGAPELKEHVAARDADAVARLKAAGAVIFGRTNVPLYTGDLQSYNKVYGTTNNPWDLARSPGGSSGGAAAALAAGLTPLELGSDSGGSIRNPAHFCGVYGHKPSYGVVPMRGHIPGPPGSLSTADIAVGGPLARSVDDLELALDILAGPDEWAGAGWALDLREPRARRLKDFRVAAWFDDDMLPLDREMRAAFAELAAALRGAGAAVDEEARPGFTLDEAHDVFFSLLTGVIGAGLPDRLYEKFAARAREAKPEDRSYLARFARGTTISHRDWLRLDARRQKMRNRWREFFTRFDVLLCPVTPTPAQPHNQEESRFTLRHFTVNGEERPYLDQMVWAGLGGVAYLPATVAPMGVGKSGLPMGVQIIGPFLEDRTTLEFARRLGEVFGGFKAPPGFEG